MKVGRKSSNHDWHALEGERCGWIEMYQREDDIAETREIEDENELKEAYCGQCEAQRRAQA